MKPGTVIRPETKKFTKYEIGEVITGKTISYYDKNGVAHKNVKPNANNLGSTRTYDQMGVLIVNSNASNIIVKRFECCKQCSCYGDAG